MPGVFNIKIENDIVYKELNTNNSIARKIKNKLSNNEDELKKYKKHLDSYKLPIIGKFIQPPLSVADDGSYTMKFIPGINLMDILDKNNHLCKNVSKWKSKEIKPDYNTTINILKQISVLENALNLCENLSLRGDWFLHNLIYSEQDNIIYNIDLEGFYTYSSKDDVCDIKKHLPNQFNHCKNKLLENLKTMV